MLWLLSAGILIQLEVKPLYMISVSLPLRFQKTHGSSVSTSSQTPFFVKICEGSVSIWHLWLYICVTVCTAHVHCEIGSQWSSSECLSGGHTWKTSCADSFQVFGIFLLDAVSPRHYRYCWVTDLKWEMFVSPMCAWENDKNRCDIRHCFFLCTSLTTTKCSDCTHN